jgi:hypothetical protein
MTEADGAVIQFNIGNIGAPNTLGRTIKNSGSH